VEAFFRDLRTSRGGAPFASVTGDDADAKADLIGIITAGGLTGIDAGTLNRAREMQSLGFLQISVAAADKISWAGGFAVIA
jgi:predicted dinucleotide-binding enzyme